jgi:hypothetical protein
VIDTQTKPITEASFPQANHWAVESGREYVVINDLEALDPFFLSVVGAGEQWLFSCSYGSLSAGRNSPESALFPYYTVDKIIDNWNSTGPWTAITCDGKLWQPFRPLIAGLSPIKRRLLKSVLGDELVFDELNEELGLRFTYRWQFSEKYGFVRKAKLTNESTQPVRFRLADGIGNFLPSGIDSRMQLQYSSLADAYKISELDCNGAMMVHRIASGIIDAPIPLESLRATTVWTKGLGEGPTYMDRRFAEEFLHGATPAAADRIRAKRGAMFLAREMTLVPEETVEWMIVADIEQSQSDVGALRRSLDAPDQLEADVEEDILKGQDRLRELVASSDGFQQTADRDTALYHYQNTLCNILRGGVPEKGYGFKRKQFLSYLEKHNKPLCHTHRSWLNALPDYLERGDLLAQIQTLQDPDLLRLAEEYLPLVLSRRHGDPSRPWNKFDIRLHDESGESIHHFEGNWRDIFQNWEALAWSHPDFLGGFIAKFLNASTPDGYNPFRITSAGVDWEAPDEEDSWVSIGYWGDHQIVYLLKLLELEAKIRPDQLSARLNSLSYVFADVPYRLKSWEKTLENPRDTVDFDRALHSELMERKATIGADGLLLRDAAGDLVRVSLAEKLILPAAVKLANMVPGGGLWMNTQKPEWNDANNALAGCGLSVVTAAYLYRYLGFLETTFDSDLLISPALTSLIKSLSNLFADPRWQQPSSTDRFDLVEKAGLALEVHRTQIYASGPGTPSTFALGEILTFLKNARKALKSVLLQNRRPDGLWHAYNILDIAQKDRAMEVDHLTLMLEGQVAILSAGILTPAEALEVLESMRKSNLRTERHNTYLLYPDRELPRFLDANQIEESKVTAIKTLADMIDRGDSSIVVKDPECGYRFRDSLTNSDALNSALGENVPDREEIEALYESVFNHRSFTGRSGTMFGYEGLGCVYWHMVSKLMLATQEVTLNAIDSGADEDIVQKLIANYYAIQGGLGFRKSPHDYGAFPAEPYSHSPAHAGAQQPGLTGQVKEGILCRIGELGIDFKNGRLSFHPRLLRDAEFAGLKAGPEHSALSSGTISFTLAQTPVSYQRRDNLDVAEAVVHFSDGSQTEAPGAVLNRETTSEITRQSGKISKIEVNIPSHWLIT